MFLTDSIYNPDPNSPLNTPCKPVTDFESAYKFGLQMLDLVEKYGAYGLAANQLGHNIQLFVMNKTIFINPVIYNHSEETELFEEGCLSFPDLYVKIKRYKEIDLKWKDETGQDQIKHFDDIWARVAQHEMDHLMGKRFFDSASKIHKEAAFRKYVNLHRKKRKTS